MGLLITPQKNKLDWDNFQIDLEGEKQHLMAEFKNNDLDTLGHSREEKNTHFVAIFLRL